MLDDNSGKRASGKPDIYSQNDEFHGHSGPIKTSFPPWRMPIEDSIMEAFDEVSGVPRPKDPWSGDHVGFYGTLSTIDRNDGKAARSYAATGYLQPNIQRQNLKVLTEAIVTRVLLDPTTATAQGVEFQHSGTIHHVLAMEEVILSKLNPKSSASRTLGYRKPQSVAGSRNRLCCTAARCWQQSTRTSHDRRDL
jgi:choline dehydrogenase-like flavoprotein